MPQPEFYFPSFSFTNFSAEFPTKQQPGQQLDAQFNALKVTTDEIITNLALIQRDDGFLANRSVGREQLREDVTLGFNAPAPWMPNTVYTSLDTVFESNKFYSAKVGHTSGATFDASLWNLIADFTAETAAAEAFALEAQAWAEKTDGPVETGPDQYSAKWWATSPNVMTVVNNITAINTVATNIQAIIDVPDDVAAAAAAADLAQEWAEKMDGPVETGPDQFSAKWWAGQAQTAFQTNNWSTNGGTWNGSSNTVTLPEDPVVAERVLFVEGGVPQRPGVDYTVSGTTLTRTVTPGAGVAYFWVLFGSAEFKAVSDGGVSTPAKLGNGVVTEPKLATNSVSTRTLIDGNVTQTKLAANAVATSNLADSAVTESKLADSAVTTAKIADTAVATAKIADSAVTNAKMASMAAASVKGRASGAGTGTPTDLTISQVLDMLGATQGAIAYRGASGWAILAPGTSGYPLVTQGAAANPQWAAPSTLTPFTKGFESTQQTFTNNGSVTVAHGLGAVPKSVQIFAVCLTAEGGWSVGNRVSIDDGPWSDAGSGNWGATILVDATNLTVRIASNGLALVNNNTGGTFTMTPANWRLILSAYA